MRCTINICSEDVVHEALDGEVVIVNLKNGRYYSLIDSASAVWDLILAGHDSVGIENALRQRFADVDGRIAASVEDFLKQLSQEGLVALTSLDTGAPEVIGVTPASAPSFLAPILNKHVDMEGMLLLDPIHDVSDQGWPEKKAD